MINIEPNVIFADMPTRIKAYTVINKDGMYTIVLNSRLTHEQNLLSYHHEMLHIENHDYEKNCDTDLIEIHAHTM